LAVIETSAPELETEKKKLSKKDAIIEDLPPDVRKSIGDSNLMKMSVKELEELAAKASMTEDELRLKEFTEKYGEEKANVLVSVPGEMLSGIPEDQILEMDLETLKALVQALEHT